MKYFVRRGKRIESIDLKPEQLTNDPNLHYDVFWNIWLNIDGQLCPVMPENRKDELKTIKYAGDDSE